MSVVKSQRGAMMLSIKAILQMKGGLNGGFLWACPVHTITGNDNMWAQGSATGVGMSDVPPRNLPSHDPTFPLSELF